MGNLLLPQTERRTPIRYSVEEKSFYVLIAEFGMFDSYREQILGIYDSDSLAKKSMEEIELKVKEKISECPVKDFNEKLRKGIATEEETNVFFEWEMINNNYMDYKRCRIEKFILNQTIDIKKWED